MILCIQKIQVICDQCHNEMLILDSWQDAAKLGWSAPIDGAFQWCAKCSETHTNKIFREHEIDLMLEERRKLKNE